MSSFLLQDSSVIMPEHVQEEVERIVDELATGVDENRLLFMREIRDSINWLLAAFNVLAKSMAICGYDEKDYMDISDRVAKYVWTWGEETPRMIE